MRFGSVKLLTIVAIFLATGIYFAIHIINLASNYVEVGAKIDSVAIDCRINSTKRSFADQFVDQLAFMDCDHASEFAQNHDLGASAVQHRVRLGVNYISPSDKLEKPGKLQEFYYSDEYKKFKVNDTVTIYVNKQQSDDITLW